MTIGGGAVLIDQASCHDKGPSDPGREVLRQCSQLIAGVLVEFLTCDVVRQDRIIAGRTRAVPVVGRLAYGRPLWRRSVGAPSTRVLPPVRPRPELSPAARPLVAVLTRTATR